MGDPSEGLVAVMNKVSHMVYEPKVVDFNGNVKYTLPAGDWNVSDTKFHDGYIVLNKWIEVPGKDSDLGYCIFDKNGKLIIPTAKYKYIEYIGEGYWQVMKNSSKDIYGVFKLPPVK